MSLSTYCNPKLYIKGHEIHYLESIKVKFTSNQINSLNIILNTTDIKEDKLQNENLELYLNYGADDSVPFFRGIIQAVKISKKNTSIVAQDPRVLLTSKGALPVNLSNKNNYDGFTAGQFLKHYIEENIWEETISHSAEDKTLVVTREQPSTLTYSDTADNAIATMGFTQATGMADTTTFTISDGFTSVTYRSCRSAAGPAHTLENIILVNGGSGYTGPPTVTVTDTTGSGSRVVPDVQATISGAGVVNGLTVVAGGEGWDPAATASVSIAAPDGPGTQATAIAINGNIDTSGMAAGTPNIAAVGAQVIKKVQENQHIAVSNVTLSGISGSGQYSVMTFQSLIAGTQGNVTITQAKGGIVTDFFDRAASNSGFSSGDAGASSSTSPSFTVDNPPIRKDTLKIEMRGLTDCGLTAGGSTGVTSNYYIKGKESSGTVLHYPSAYETDLLSSANTSGETISHATAISGSNTVGSTDDSPHIRITSGTVNYMTGEVNMTFNKPPRSESGNEPFYISYEQAGSSLKPKFLDVMNDTSPPIILKKVRGQNIEPYKLVQDNLKQSLDTSVYEEPKKWIIDTVEGSELTYITFTQRKSLDSSPTYEFSYKDGLVDLKHQKRVPANTAIVTGGNGAKFTFVYGNRPNGIVSVSETIESTNNADCYEAAVQLILKDFDENAEVQAIASKAPYIALENLVDINVNDNNIDGNTRVTGKSVSWKKGKGLTVILDLNRTPVKVSDFLTLGKSGTITSTKLSDEARKREIINWRRGKLGLPPK